MRIVWGECEMFVLMSEGVREAWSTFIELFVVWRYLFIGISGLRRISGRLLGEEALYIEGRKIKLYYIIVHVPISEIEEVKEL